MQPTNQIPGTCHSSILTVILGVASLQLLTNCQQAPPTPPRSVVAGAAMDEIDASLATYSLECSAAELAMQAFSDAIPGDADPNVDPECGPRRADTARQIHAELSLLEPPENSAGYLLFRTHEGIVFLRGELPDEATRLRLVEHFQKKYPDWHIDDRTRVDERLTWPEEGSLLTLRSLPSAQLAASTPLMAYANFGRPWSHCAVGTLEPDNAKLDQLGLTENARARLDLVLLLAPVTAGNSTTERPKVQ